MDKKQYDTYLHILKKELIPAMGCTEPIAIAFAAAKARELLGKMPTAITMLCSGNIIKNVKGVVVPNSGGYKGVEAAALLGCLAGRPELELEVIRDVTPEKQDLLRHYLKEEPICLCKLAEGEENLFIRAEMTDGKNSVAVEIRTRHNHISRLEKNGEIIFQEETSSEAAVSKEKESLHIADILEFANEVAISDIEEIIGRQISYNAAISEEGLLHAWGSQIGKTILALDPSGTRSRAKAAAAAGSDARMNGCPLPVVINSGSGNQGITCTMPVVIYAEEWQVSKEQLYRALVVANLISLHQKRYIGNLSAYCGAVSAGAAAACGIAYLRGESYDVIGKTLVNTLANIGGIICDGAKASCAAKISTAVDAGIFGYEMARRELTFPFGEGIVEQDYEKTIQNIGRVGRVGMRSTDIEVLNIMVGN